ncbi:MAG: hypothetical protein HYV41_04465 [Candidatus Magasanikbacteria bacterium]|nr:hypothetical protein [Candidatus Magasanikbacteria bacterium]
MEDTLEINPRLPSNEIKLKSPEVRIVTTFEEARSRIKALSDRADLAVTQELEAIQTFLDTQSDVAPEMVEQFDQLTRDLAEAKSAFDQVTEAASAGKVAETPEQKLERERANEVEKEKVPWYTHKLNKAEIKPRALLATVKGTAPDALLTYINDRIKNDGSLSVELSRAEKDTTDRVVKEGMNEYEKTARSQGKTLSEEEKNDKKRELLGDALAEVLLQKNPQEVLNYLIDTANIRLEDFSREMGKHISPKEFTVEKLAHLPQEARAGIIAQIPDDSIITGQLVPKISNSPGVRDGVPQSMIAYTPEYSARETATVAEHGKKISDLLNTVLPELVAAYTQNKQDFGSETDDNRRDVLLKERRTLEEKLPESFGLVVKEITGLFVFKPRAILNQNTHDWTEYLEQLKKECLGQSSYVLSPLGEKIKKRKQETEGEQLVRERDYNQFEKAMKPVDETERGVKTVEENKPIIEQYLAITSRVVAMVGEGENSKGIIQTQLNNATTIERVNQVLVAVTHKQEALRTSSGSLRQELMDISPALRNILGVKEALKKIVSVQQSRVEQPALQTYVETQKRATNERMASVLLNVSGITDYQNPSKFKNLERLSREFEFLKNEAERKIKTLQEQELKEEEQAGELQEIQGTITSIQEMLSNLEQNFGEYNTKKNEIGDQLNQEIANIDNTAQPGELLKCIDLLRGYNEVTFSFLSRSKEVDTIDGKKQKVNKDSLPKLIDETKKTIERLREAFERQKKVDRTKAKQRATDQLNALKDSLGRKFAPITESLDKLRNNTPKYPANKQAIGAVLPDLERRNSGLVDKFRNE